MRLQFALLVVALACAAACELAGLAKYRSARVASATAHDVAFNFTGFWYEQAYSDPAQLASSCQTLNATLLPTGVVNTDFSVRYGAIPFTITEIYTPSADQTAGLYTKTVNEPGGQFVKLNTVLVEAERDDHVIIYSCLGPINEIVIATRERYPDVAVVDRLLARASSLGIPVAAGSVSKPSWKKCP